MTYYFISSEPSYLDEFKRCIPALVGVPFVREDAEVDEIFARNAGTVFFLVPLSGTTEVENNRILLIRKKAPQAKLVYITDSVSAKDLKSHQKTALGGDAYVSFNTDSKDFFSILESLESPGPNEVENRLEESVGDEFEGLGNLDAFKNHPVGEQIDELFRSVIRTKPKKPLWQSADALAKPILDEVSESGEPMSTHDKSLSLDHSDDLEIDIGGEEVAKETTPLDEGLELSLGEEMNLDLSDVDAPHESGAGEDFGEISLGEENEEGDFALEEEDEELPPAEDPETFENLGELSFAEEEGNSVAELSGDLTEEDGLSLNSEDDFTLGLGVDADLSDDAREKLKEIDAIMDFDATQAALHKNQLMELNEEENEEDEEVEKELVSDVQENDSLLDEPLVSDDLNLDSLNFAAEEVIEPVAPVESKKKKREAKESKERDLGADLKEISGAYSGEMERMQATISNLRSDREELLKRIQNLEEEKVLQGRQTLTLRAELDEKKIELTIIRKKLNEELSEMKDRLKLFDEKRLILEEKNRVLTQELDKTSQKNKMDVKKVQMRERELEQKLELLKSDAETQIRNRDLKILELKRKMDAMEFDMESISLQEKRSVESRFELEDKLDKAIKTLRNAITVLEDETDRTNALNALKKNIDM